MPHIINRLYFELNCREEEEAFNLRHNFTSTLQAEIAEVIDEVCSRCLGEDQSVRIDRLEIDMGQLSPHAFHTSFREIFRYKFEKELSEKLAFVDPLLLSSSHPRSLFESLCFFLIHGFLPWWENEEDLPLEQIDVAWCKENENGIRIFLDQHRFNKVVWNRIAFQTDPLVRDFIISLFPGLQQAKKQYEEWIKRICDQLDGEIEPETFGLISLERVSTAVLEQAPVLFLTSPPGIAKIFLNHYLQQFVNEPDDLLRLFRIAHEVTGLEWQEQMVQNETGRHMATKAQGISIKTPVTDDSDFISSTQFDLPSPDPIRQGDTAEESERLMVRHAGIILLAPFLKLFFTEMDLLNGNEWKDREACWRGVHLLGYLGTGEEELPEYCLLLEKLLCGLPMEEPIPRELPLSEKEKREAELLLQAVITHWKILKHTSISGLRESFLKRDGILRKKETGWLLQVERKTLDVLLDSIPWGFSTVLLPWNPQPLFVEW